MFPFNFYTVFQFYYWQKCIRIYIKLCFFRKITLVHVIHQFLELLHGALARSWITRSIMSEVINLVRNGIKRLNVGEFHLPTGLRDCLICCFLPFVCKIYELLAWFGFWPTGGKFSLSRSWPRWSEVVRNDPRWFQMFLILLSNWSEMLLSSIWTYTLLIACWIWIQISIRIRIWIWIMVMVMIFIFMCKWGVLSLQIFTSKSTWAVMHEG